jgi:Tfp pilus assembly protein PilF
LTNQDGDRALEDFLKALSIHPSHPGAYRNAATVYLSKGRVDHAVQMLEQAVRVNPGDTELALALSEAWIQQDKWQKALVLLEKSLKKPLPSEQKSRLLVLRALALERSGNLRKALKSYEQALEEAEDPGVRDRLARKIAELSSRTR